MKSTLALFAALAAPILAGAAQPVRVLIVTGQSDTQYHNWRLTTPFIEKVLGDAGRFETRVTQEPKGITRDTLAGYDVIVFNYMGPRFGKAAETAIEEFVRSGKGFVSFHGTTYGPLMGTIQSPGGGWRPGEPWAAYSDMLGVSWAAENIGHAVRHAFTVKLADREHPITAGLDPEFTVNDELYHKMNHHPGIHVLAAAYDDPARGGTGKSEPIAWTNSYGKGRVYHCTLGHDTNALYEPEAMRLFARAVEWAGAGSVEQAAPPKDDAVRVLVVTGGHAYEPSFYEVFQNRPGIHWTHATSQQEAFTPGMKDRWDVTVLYDMYNEIGEAERKNLREYVEAGKGVVALHHAIVDYTSWPWWYEQVIGGKYFEKPVEGHTASHYKEGVEMIVRPAKGMENHPIVRGLGELVTEDECYRGMWHAPGIKVLMETGNDLNDRPVVYLGPSPAFRAVYIQLGHDSFTHRHPGYQALVHNAILWAAGRTR
ncbi:MAG: ThuA domain-containing protein [Acidobacteriota bacterium]